MRVPYLAGLQAHQETLPISEDDQYDSTLSKDSHLIRHAPC